MARLFDGLRDVDHPTILSIVKLFLFTTYLLYVNSTIFLKKRYYNLLNVKYL